MKLAAALAITVLTLSAQRAGRTPHEPAPPHDPNTVSALHYNMAGDVLRVTIDVSGDFQFRTDRLHNPERVYFDIPNSLPDFGGHRMFSEDLNSALVKRVRVAETMPGVTRIVFDLIGNVQLSSTMRLRSPSRLQVEMRPGAPTIPAPVTETAAPLSPAPAHPVSAAPAPRTEPRPLRRFTPPAIKTPPVVTAVDLRLPVSPDVRANRPNFTVPPADPPRPDPLPVRLQPKPAVAQSTPPDAPLKPEIQPKPEAPHVTSSDSRSLKAEVMPPVAGGPGATEDARPARRTAAGVTSLTRALGLKLNRVVIDPGHGGHDQGTAGPTGLLEKELVLDVSLRLGKLIEDRLGAEVIYTRTTDVFVPLERRPQFANEKRADLFLSVHANSSPYPAITGVETYVLNFTDNRSALDVAMRENATSERPMSELRDLTQKITAHDKAQESREFAAKIQAALYGFSRTAFPGEYNRGVKQAPFVVLIGTTMPAVLTEIGFVTNSKEESLLKRPDYRQKLAESIYRGVAKYAEGLSHFEVAQVPSGN